MAEENDKNFPGSPEFEGWNDDGQEQLSLDFLGIETPELDWESQWKGMPEFKRFDAEPFQKIIVNFRNWEDVKLFAEKLGIKATKKTDSVWWPPYKTPTGIFVDSKENEDGTDEAL